MNITRIMCMTAGCCLLLGCASILGLGGVRAKEKIIVNATVDASWGVISDFCSIAIWHPAVNRCVQKGDLAANAVRVLTLADGGQIMERLLKYSTKDKSYTYAITGGVLPVTDYISTISVAKYGSGRSTVTWQSNFGSTPGHDDNEVTKLIEEIYTAGLQQIKQLAEDTAGQQ